MPNYCIMNVDKQSRGAVFGLQIEANRNAEDRDSRDFTRSDINWDKTCENVFLRRVDNWGKEITRQIKQAGVKERKDSVVLITGVYTASPEWFESHTQEEAMAYFRDCLAWHDKTYGHAFNAVIHMDETTPHMQVASVPIIEDDKGKHLSAKIIMGNRTKYQQRQDSFFEEVGKVHSMDRGERRGPDEHRANKERLTWQKEQIAENAMALAGIESGLHALEEERQSLQTATEESRKQAEQAQAALEEMRQEKLELHRSVVELEHSRDALVGENARQSADTAEKVKKAEEAEKSAQRAAERAAKAKKEFEQTAAALQRIAGEEPTVKRKLGGREVVEVSPEDYKTLQIAARNYRDAVDMLKQREKLFDQAKADIDSTLKQAHIEIRSYREEAAKAVEEFKQNLDNAKRISRDQVNRPHPKQHDHDRHGR